MSHRWLSHFFRGHIAVHCGLVSISDEIICKSMRFFLPKEDWVGHHKLTGFNRFMHFLLQLFHLVPIIRPADHRASVSDELLHCTNFGYFLSRFVWFLLDTCRMYTVIFKVAFSTFRFKFGATLRRQAERRDSGTRQKASNLAQPIS